MPEVPGGSVGVDRFDILETIHTELKAATHYQMPPKKCRWMGTTIKTSHLPAISSGQSYQQPTPEEPELSMSMGTIGKPPFNPGFIPYHHQWVDSDYHLGMVYKKQDFLSIMTPILFIGGIEALIAQLVNHG